MNDAWNIPGWTAQQPFPAEVPPPGITLPPSFTAVEVTGRFVNNEGKPINGSRILFTPSARRVSVEDTVVWLKKVDKRIEKGALTVRLLVTDVPGAEFVWHVKECFPGGEEYDITVPADSPSPVSLFSLPRYTHS